MDARTLESAAEDLHRRRRRAVEAGALGALAGLVACGALLVSTPLAAALFAGAVLQAGIALALVDGRRELIARLALDPAAYALAEVHRYGARVAEHSKRARLAAWLAEVASDDGVPGALHLRDRVALVAGELEALARELRSPALSVPPATVVACRRLLTHPAESPLYNPRLTADDLRLAVRRLRADLA